MNNIRLFLAAFSTMFTWMTTAEAYIDPGYWRDDLADAISCFLWVAILRVPNKKLD